VLQSIGGVPGLNPASVTITSSPSGSQGASVTATSAGVISFTAPTNKSGTFVISFTYTAYGVTVQGSTLTVTVT